MATDSIITNNGKIVLLQRGYTVNGSLSATQYLAPIQFKVGIENGTPSITNTDLDIAVPIDDGTTNDDGSNTLTGSTGGDNSTNNTTTFKQGAGNSDVTSQNLIANNTNVSKIWTIADLSSAGTNITGTEPFALWFNINLSTALAKFKSSSTALEIRLGSDAGNYYFKTWTAAELAVGWNWISSGTTAVNALTENGTVAGAIDTFVIVITTNNSTDTFTTGDVLSDLLRQWATSDLVKNFVSGYPTFDNTNKEVTIRCFISSVEANGFDINGQALFNADTSILMTDESTFTAESKSLNDEFAFVIKNRIL